MRLHRLAWLLALPLAHASAVAEKLSVERQRLYTSTAAYCSNPDEILISSMDVQFFRHNASLEFQLTASARPSNVSMSADLNLFAYGRDMFNMSIDLCEIGGGSLCPVPQYNFSGSGIFNVPEEYASRVPDIVYSVPDIEALGVMRLIEQGTNNTVGCMQVTLSNGLTTRTERVVWATMGFTIAAAVAMVCATLYRDSLSSLRWRVVDVVSTLHTVAFASMLTLIIPLVYHQFSLSFAWSVGLIFIRPVQNAIYKTRLDAHTNDDGIFYSALMKAYYSRLANLYPAVSLNPDSPAVFSGSSNSLGDIFGSALGKRALYAPNTGPGGEMDSGGSSQSVVLASDNIGFSQTGIYYYSESLDISPNSAFLTVLVNWLFVLCIALVVLLLVGLLATFVHAIAQGRRVEQGAPEKQPLADDTAVEESRVLTEERREGHTLGGQPFLEAPAAATGLAGSRIGRAVMPFLNFTFFYVRPIVFRVVEVATPPLLVFILFQFAHATGWPSHVSAAFILAALVLTWIAMLGPMFMHVAETRDAHSLYFSEYQSPWDTYGAATRVGTMAEPYRPKYYWFATVHLVCHFLRACFIALPQRNDLAMRQTVGLLTVDVILFLLLVILRPGRDKWTDFVQYILALFRIVCWALGVVLTTQANIWGIPRAVIGFVLFAVVALAVVFIFFVFLWDIIAALFSRQQRWTGRYGKHVQVVEKMHGAPYSDRPTDAYEAQGYSDEREHDGHERHEREDDRDVHEPSHEPVDGHGAHEREATHVDNEPHHESGANAHVPADNGPNDALPVQSQPTSDHTQPATVLNTERDLPALPRAQPPIVGAGANLYSS